MKKFAFRYSVAVYIILGLSCALSLTGTVWNIINMVNGQEGYRIVSSSIIIAVALAVLSYCISLLVNSRYEIKGDKLYSHFGFFGTSARISDIIALTYFRISDKLVIYFSDGTYTVAIIKPANYGDFIAALRAVNPSITFSNNDDEEENN